MKLSKFIFPIFPITIFLILNFFFNIPTNINNIPATTNKEEFIKKLKHGLDLAKIDTKNTKINQGLNQISFYYKDTKIIFSMNKNPYSQITTLQETQKIATINKNQLRLIDLSIEHPYASF